MKLVDSMFYMKTVTSKGTPLWIYNSGISGASNFEKLIQTREGLSKTKVRACEGRNDDLRQCVHGTPRTGLRSEATILSYISSFATRFNRRVSC